MFNYKLYGFKSFLCENSICACMRLCNIICLHLSEMYINHICYTLHILLGENGRMENENKKFKTSKVVVDVSKIYFFHVNEVEGSLNVYLHTHQGYQSTIHVSNSTRRVVYVQAPINFS